MRLVLQFENSDGYTYSCTDTHPVEYDSAEALLVNLMDAAQAGLRQGGSFPFLGLDFASSHFFEELHSDCEEIGGPQPEVIKVNERFYRPNPPDIFTVDEWFERALTAGTDRAQA